MGAGWRKEAIDLGSPQSRIFFGAELDDPNRVESADEIGFYAHAIFSRPSRAYGAISAEIDPIRARRANRSNRST
jgi:hypothetical protein